MRYESVIILIFAVFFITGCEYEKIPVNPDSGVIRGKVLDAVSGPTLLLAEPLSEANISTYPDAGKVLSDKDGLFWIDNVLPGYYYLNCSKEGFYDIKQSVEVFSRDVSRSTLLMLPVVEGNSYPGQPFDPFPFDSLRIFGYKIRLRWYCEDSNDIILYYDVFFGKTNPPMEMIKFNALDNFADIDTLEEKTTYYWQVLAKDYFGATTEGRVWMFSTR